MSENEEDISNNGSILNTVKTEPSDILNDSIEHHRNSFPAALLGLQGYYLTLFFFIHFIIYFISFIMHIKAFTLLMTKLIIACSRKKEKY